MATLVTTPKKKQKPRKLTPEEMQEMFGPKKPQPAWGQQTPTSILIPSGPVVTPPKYIGPPLTAGPIPGTATHLKAWIDIQVNRKVSWCDAIQGGGYKENQGPSYPHVVSSETYETVRTWWELKGTVKGPNGTSYTCASTDPSDKDGRTLQIGASTQGNILATTSKIPPQTRLNLHIDIS